ncbi:MAG: hydroxylamine reductase, partial [Eggerthellaceae bacterium]|nr:hydroxylamine reductase [Eggerthellaceae bacterium]
MSENTTQMFCFQCEQTAGCTACTGSKGTCGKTAEVAGLQDELTGALVGFARSTYGNEDLVTVEMDALVEKALFATLTNVNFSEESLQQLIEEVLAAKGALVEQCGECASPCGRNDDYDLNALWAADEDVRSLKSLLLFGIRGVAAYAYHARVLGYTDERIGAFLREALYAIGMDDYGLEELLPLVMKTGEVNLVCMELLDKANTESFGTPEPTTVELAVEEGPFIVVSGHDLLDLKLLLDQTRGMGVSVYTHGEMLPAHAYPQLKAYPHLKGHFGTAWQNQQAEFESIPGAVLFTTNCIMPPSSSYADRVFTTSV